MLNAQAGNDALSSHALFCATDPCGVTAATAQGTASRPLPLYLRISPALSIPLGDSALYFAAGGGVAFPLAPILSVFARGRAGWWFGSYNDEALSSTNPCLSAGAGVRVALGPVVSVELAARYDWLAGLSQGLAVSLGTTLALGAETSAPLPSDSSPQPVPLVLDILPSFTDTFPVFFKYYDDHPIGKIQIENRGETPVSNVRVQFLIKQYMDEPKEMAIDGSIPPGGTAETEIYALLTDSILAVMEGTKSAAQLVVGYDQDGQRREEKKIATVSFHGRNAMTWDDDRKAAAYVTAKDPQVLGFARSVTSSVQGSEKRSINQNLQAAIAIHEALDLYGLNYVPSPTMPYEEASRQETAVDFLQFPRETFEYKSGDCSDISILYCALLQAVGIALSPDGKFLYVANYGSNSISLFSVGAGGALIAAGTVSTGLFTDRYRHQHGRQVPLRQLSRQHGHLGLYDQLHLGGFDLG